MEFHPIPIVVIFLWVDHYFRYHYPKRYYKMDLWGGIGHYHWNNKCFLYHRLAAYRISGCIVVYIRSRCYCYLCHDSAWYFRQFFVIDYWVNMNGFWQLFPIKTSRFWRCLHLVALLDYYPSADWFHGY
jgi:hypothetical protein